MQKPAKTTRSKVEYATIGEDDAGQRIDNYLIGKFKNVPKSRVYRIVRKGEVRVNSKRVSAFYKLKREDVVRLPPVFMDEEAPQAAPSQSTIQLLSGRILYEDELLLIINKPSGMSVHVGSTVRMGVIEALRHMYPQYPQLELAHRLDTETSGCLVLAKRKRVLRELHQLLREGKMSKKYVTLTKGVWDEKSLRVDLPLHKDYRDGGKHVVEVSHTGKASLTEFRPKRIFGQEASLVEVKLFTGRTHQIRVHAAYKGHPVAGDDRYGDAEFNKQMRQLGLKRLFLHAKSIDFTLPSSNQHIKVIAPLDPDLQAVIDTFDKR